ncbi:zinc finger domain-containing protein [Streptomyces lonegramiae]|uniref:DNA-binding phage zinc finger domain-containing protein n=1 Tax=Streptomyces lonegramiae TaxID=3075524 RepID=A0ABU2XQ93_9ACTN|nr:hypothetical protein [Streptomyces sp. DSM 41529]MDT0547665.1 hypothetical protein [Streptomyces sp. DSM 41529]
MIARRRNGAARRVEISAQEVEEAFRLLQYVPSPEARQLQDKFAAVLRPVCFWASSRTGRHSNYPAWGPCGVFVSAPNQRCVEHQWPLPADVSDPFPDRCTVTLDEELEDSRWVQYSGGLRCPFKRRRGSERCAHHDPRDGELCGYPVDDGATCTTAQGAFACRTHQYVRLTGLKSELEQLPLTLECGYCDAASGESCTNRNGQAVAFHKKRVNAVQGSQEHQELSDTIEWLSL